MADRTITGTLELNARGVEILSNIDSKIDKITHTGRTTAAATSFIAWNEIVNRLSQGFDLAKRGLESLLEAGMQAERTKATWGALLGSDQTLVETRIKQLETFAAKAPFTFGNIQQAAIQLQATGNYSLEALKSAGDAAAIFSQDITGTVRDMLSALRGEIEPIKKYGISVMDIQRELGHDMVESTKRTAKDTDEIWQALIRLMEKRGVDGMSKIMDTVSGKLTNLTDAWDRAKKQMGGELMGGASTGLDAALTTLNRMLADGTFERAGQALGSVLAGAMDLAAGMAQRGGTISEIMQKSGKGGVGEYVFSPDLSRISQRRQGAGIVGGILQGQGADVKGLFGTWELSGEQQAIADRCALMLLNGVPESQVRTYASSALLQMAYVGVKEGPAFAPPPRPSAPPGSTSESTVVSPAAKPWWTGEETLLGEGSQQQREGKIREMGIETYTILGDAADLYADRQSRVWERILRDGTGAYEGMTAASVQAVNVMTTWGELFATKETRRHLTLKAFGEWAIKSEVAAFLAGLAKKEGARAVESAIRAADYLAEALITQNPLAYAAASAAGAAALQHGALAALEGGAAAVFTNQANRAMGAIRDPESQLPAYGGGGGGGGYAGSSGSTRLVASATAPANYTFAITINHMGATVYGSGGAKQFWQDELLPLAQEAAASGQLSVDPMRRN